MQEDSLYWQLGVDPQKHTVREIFGAIVDNDFPDAFVPVKRDPDFPGYVFTLHADGDGSKFVQRLLHMEETGDVSVIKGAVDDAFEMNLGDIAASGFVSDGSVIALNQILDINPFTVDKDTVMRQIALRVAELLAFYREQGMNVSFMGGETADLPNQVSSVVYNVNVYARGWKHNLITGENIRHGDRIYGFASDGQAAWEDTHNYGLMSNGATQARLMLMSKKYNDVYPHLCGRGKPYKGKYRISKPEDIFVSEAILSPTRTWSVVIKKIIDALKSHDMFHKLHGISMNTGGGATKVGHLGSGIVYQKRMPPPPELFELIQNESNDSWEHMYEAFNCGVGIDIIGDDDPEFERVLRKVEEETHIRMFQLGVCKRAADSDTNAVVLRTPYGTFEYQH